MKSVQIRMVRHAALVAGFAGAAFAGAAAWADVVTVSTTAARTFFPSVVTVHPGDTVHFNVQSCCHSVDQSSSAASCTPLTGGFSTHGCGATGLDVVIPANATGSIFYICQCHCALGMKGRIDIVASCNAAGVSSHPTDTETCPGGSASFTVVASGTAPFTYQWKHGVTNVGGPSASPTLNLTNVSPSDGGSYTCVVTNGCGNATSNAAILNVCHADFNCDGSLDFFDYDDFVNAFEAGTPSADFNGDTAIDFFDYDDFVTAFETGC